jgi:hypothetical protein
MVDMVDMVQFCLCSSNPILLLLCCLFSGEYMVDMDMVNIFWRIYGAGYVSGWIFLQGFD